MDEWSFPEYKKKIMTGIGMDVFEVDVHPDILDNRPSSPICAAPTSCSVFVMIANDFDVQSRFDFFAGCHDVYGDVEVCKYSSNLVTCEFVAK